MHIIQILDWLQRKKGKFTGHDTQIEILKLMALSVLREIVVNLQRTEFYTLARLNLALNKVRGQCYDGASTMRGLPNGVAMQTQDANPEPFIPTDMAIR